jgi:uncharacterized protein YwqG
MSLFSALIPGFGRDRKRDKGIQEHLEYLRSLRLPGLGLSESAGGCASRIGGRPSLPESVPWPEWKGAPLAFLCQIDLNAIPDTCDRRGLPRDGMLSFFYHQNQETWGFDPADRGSWRVVYQEAGSSPGPPRFPPPGLAAEAVYRPKDVRCHPIETYPDATDDRVLALDLSERQYDEYVELCQAVHQGGPAHQLFGYPMPIQGNNMDLECQLVSHGLYCGSPAGFNDPKTKKLEPGRSEWMLLLQLDSDDDTGMVWGDAGMLYFWIKQSDLARSHFDDCWMIVQCS